jgi:hypothetical protein
MKSFEQLSTLKLKRYEFSPVRADGSIGKLQKDSTIIVCDASVEPAKYIVIIRNALVYRGNDTSIVTEYAKNY